MEKKTLSGMAMAAAVASLLATTPASAISNSDVGIAGVHCMGVNSCKGKSACKSGADNKCKGQNGCKGTGFVTTTKEMCDQLGGKVESSTPVPSTVTPTDSMPIDSSTVPSTVPTSRDSTPSSAEDE